MPESPVTIRQIAEHLGISKSTVSLALQGKGRVAEATRKRVREAAEALGYWPDPLLSAFSRRRGKNVSPGSVIAFIRPNPVKFEIQRNLIDLAENLGYRFERFALSHYPSQSALARTLAARGVAGVFFPEVPTPIELEPGIWEPFRGVYCGPYPTGDETCPLDVVRHNPFDAVLLAWQKAREAGCERIALLLPTQNPAPSNLELKTLAAYRLMREEAAGAVPHLEPFTREFQKMIADMRGVSEWYYRVQPDVVMGGFHALYPLLCSNLENFRETGRFLSLRATADQDDVAGCCLEREVIAEIALRRLHAHIQDPLPTGNHSTSLVVNPTWRPGKSFHPGG